MPSRYLFQYGVGIEVHIVWEVGEVIKLFLSFAGHSFMKWKQNLVPVYAEYKMFEQENTDGRQALDWGEKGSLGEMREVRYRIQHQVQYLIVYLKRNQNTRNDSDQQLEVT